MKILKTAKYKKISGLKERGKRDGTGPFEGSAQRSVKDKGMRQQKGEECPFNDEKDEKRKRDGTGPNKRSVQKLISDKGKRKERGEKCPLD